MGTCLGSASHPQCMFLKSWLLYKQKGETSEAPLDPICPKASNSERTTVMEVERRECSSRSKHFSGYKSSHFNISLCHPGVFLDRGSSSPAAQGVQSSEQTFQLETSPQDTILRAILAPFLHTTPAEHPQPFLTKSAQGLSNLPSPQTEMPQGLQTQTNPFPETHHLTQRHVNRTPNTWQWTICSLLIKN